MISADLAIRGGLGVGECQGYRVCSKGVCLKSVDQTMHCLPRAACTLVKQYKRCLSSQDFDAKSSFCMDNSCFFVMI